MGTSSGDGTMAPLEIKKLAGHSLGQDLCHCLKAVLNDKIRFGLTRKNRKG